jgi:uncharacterized membrane protein
MTPKANGYWVDCSVGGKACSKSKQAGADRLALSGPHKGQPICGGCAKATKVQRSHEAEATDLEAQRKAKTSGEVRTALKAGAHKGLYTKGGQLKGGPGGQLSDEEYQALRGVKKAAQPKAKPVAKAAAQPKAKARVQRPKAKAV